MADSRTNGRDGRVGTKGSSGWTTPHGRTHAPWEEPHEYSPQTSKNSQMPSPRLRDAALLVLLLPIGGCCSLARFFCGPDTTPWVPISYETPEAALATLLEAIRRENVTQIYNSLSDGYKQRLGGADRIAAEVGWQRIKEQVPGVHMLGYVQVPAEPARRADRGVTYELEAYGERVRIDLVRQSFWTVLYQDAAGTVHEVGAVLPHDSLNGLVRVDPRTDPIDQLPASALLLDELLVVHPTLKTLPLSNILQITIAREWQVNGLAPASDSPRPTPPATSPTNQ